MAVAAPALTVAAQHKREGGQEMRTITVEEHYATAAFMDGPGRQLAALADSVREHPQVAAGRGGNR
jgi:hypothetical protein